jgi:hypothetical protein
MYQIAVIYLWNMKKIDLQLRLIRSKISLLFVH